LGALGFRTLAFRDIRLQSTVHLLEIEHLSSRAS
jgi:hypothetical protein